MPGNLVFMIVAIVAISTFGRIYMARTGHDRDGRAIAPPADDGEARALRDEVRALKDRIAVLERIATDGHETARIDAEIARLRDR